MIVHFDLDTVDIMKMLLWLRDIQAWRNVQDTYGRVVAIEFANEQDAIVFRLTFGTTYEQ